MRHKYSGRTLGRASAHRNALLRNLSQSLLEHELIKTTLPKAKELRRFLEPLITLAKVDTLANRRIVFNRLRSKTAVGKLFSDIAPRCNRLGGYLRVIKCGFRLNDNAPIAWIELVDREIATEPTLSSKEITEKDTSPFIDEKVEKSVLSTAPLMQTASAISEALPVKDKSQDTTDL